MGEGFWLRSEVLGWLGNPIKYSASPKEIQPSLYLNFGHLIPIMLQSVPHDSLP